MTLNFKDYFSNGSQAYAEYRPRYPKELFLYLQSITSAQHRAWDCATGNGQAALELVPYFDEVIASDASQSQIANAIANTSLRYCVATAENTSIENLSIDLITVAQAVHWFDQDKFFDEVNRVLKTDAILAVWCYGLVTINNRLDPIISHLYDTLIKPYWPPERKIIDNAYRDIVFPFQEITCPSFDMHSQWNLAQLLGYLGTWSAVKNYQADNTVNPLDSIMTELTRAWGDPDKKRLLSWPLILKVWKK